MKITENLVKKLSNGKSFHSIQTLDLSDQGIIGTLDSSILQKLTNLTVLDISQNEVTDIPSCTSFNKLETLDCSYNELTTLDFLQNFNKCKQLYIDGNDKIAIEDKVKLFRMYPQLDYVDDIKRSAVRNFRERYEVMVKSKWEVLFAAKYAEGFSPEKTVEILEEFYLTLTSDLLFKNITDNTELAILKDMAAELVEKAQDKSLFNDDGPSRGTPRSARLNHKFFNKDSPLTPQSPQGRRTPQTDTKTPVSKPSRKRAREDTPTESPSNRPSKRARDTTPPSKDIKRRSFTGLKNKELEIRGRLPAVGDFDPAFFIRCHSADNDPNDDKTKVWRCAFEPSIGDNYNYRYLATCGGQNVCLIDTETGLVMKRYKDNSKEEDFYAMAWGTIPYGTDTKEKTNILAVAGNNGYIKLIHPSQFVMYATLEGHHDYVSCLLFHPQKPTYLFSGAKDRKIILWDVGIPDFKNYTTNYQKLLTLNTAHTDALNLIYSTASKMLIAGCEKSCYGWRFNDMDKVTKDPNIEFLIPSTMSDVDSGDTDDVEVVDGLALLDNDYIAAKCVGSGSLVIWNLRESLPLKQTKGLQTVEVTVAGLLHYNKTSVDYINLGANDGLLSAGDDKGSVYLYDMGGFTTRSDLRPKFTGQVIEYSWKIEWPEVKTDPNKNKIKDMSDLETIVINCCCSSEDHRTIACGTDNNLVCIWKKNRILFC